jgi:hypothetical protein
LAAKPPNHALQRARRSRRAAERRVSMPQMRSTLIASLYVAAVGVAVTGLGAYSGFASIRKRRIHRTNYPAVVFVNSTFERVIHPRKRLTGMPITRVFLVSLSLCTLVQAYEATTATAGARKVLAVVSGELRVPGLRAPVRVLRDRWGVAHIYAQNQISSPDRIG